jgi:hypothetical protein
MTLPPTLTLKVDCPQGGDLSGLLFIMTVTSGPKNPYHIHFPHTSADGTSQLSSQDFRGQFKDHGDTFIMDYSGSVEIASDVVSLDLYDTRLMIKGQAQILRWPLSKYEQTVWRSRKEFVDYFLTCRNLGFDFVKQSVTIPPDGVIHLTVSRKIGVDTMLPNKSPEPTADGAVSSASRFTAFRRRWLSFFR